MVFSTLGAPQAPARSAARRGAARPTGAGADAGADGRATVIGAPAFATRPRPRRGCEAAGDADGASSDALRRAEPRRCTPTGSAAADPYVPRSPRAAALRRARIGYGTGDEVVEGRWTEARELLIRRRAQRRARCSRPQERLAGILGGREPALASEDLALRARLTSTRAAPARRPSRLRVALEAALRRAARGHRRRRAALAERLAELRERARAPSPRGGRRGAVERPARRGGGTASSRRSSATSRPRCGLAPRRS